MSITPIFHITEPYAINSLKICDAVQVWYDLGGSVIKYISKDMRFYRPSTFEMNFKIKNYTLYFHKNIFITSLNRIEMGSKEEGLVVIDHKKDQKKLSFFIAYPHGCVILDKGHFKHYIDSSINEVTRHLFLKSLDKDQLKTYLRYISL